jgi:drug/metabolite transporter (DMT)-like permease
LLVTAAALSYAIGSLLIHRKLTFAQPLGIATAAMLVSTAVLLVPGLLSLPDQAPSTRSSLALVALGIVFTGVTLTIFYGLIARAGPARATLAFYLSPGVTVVFGGLLLDERISWSIALGLVAIVAGSALAANRGSPDRYPSDGRLVNVSGGT